MNNQRIPVVTREILIPFILITSCFALWGFANDITNPMVAAFEKIFLTGTSEATWVQVAFYGGYGFMAIPAALFIRRFTYKSGILMGLALYAIGGFMFIPATKIGTFTPFLFAYFVITCGLSFLETSANPFILSMGDQRTATRRLNLAQAFNPMGSLLGMFVASQFILANMDSRDKATRQLMATEEFEVVKAADLNIVSQPYIIIGIVILIVFVIIAMVSMPDYEEDSEHQDLSLKGIFGRLVKSPRYREGVIAQTFYVGAQIMCWTFIIHYGTEVFTAQGLSEQAAQVKSQNYNIVAMIIFVTSRFICTFLLKYIKPGLLLTLLALGGIILTLGVIYLGGLNGLICLVLVSACMSLMFPTIYGIALKGITGDDAKLAAAGLIMAIVGGTFLPKIQASIIDAANVRVSFWLPVLCFIVIAVYGWRVIKIHSLRFTK